MQGLTSARARIGWICPYLPWPGNSGGRLRIHHLASGLGGDELLLFAYPSPDDPDPGGIDTDSPLPPWSERHLFAADEGRRHREVFAPSSATRTPEGLNQALRAAHTRQPLDAIVIEHCYALGGLRWPVGVPALLDEHNIESDYHRGRAAASPSAALAIEYLGWRRFERAAWRRVDGVAVVCDEDARAVGKVRRDAACVIDNAADAGQEPFRPPSLRPGHQVLFVGHLSYRPNVEAATLLATEVLPRLRRLVPAARLVLAGRCPMPEVGGLASPLVRVLADVEDVAPLYEGSAACAVPITLGAGTSLKVLEVLRTGVPLVATGFAVRGFGLVPGVHYLRAEGPQETAEALAAVLTDRGRFDEMARRGWALASSFTWERSARRFAAWVHAAIRRARGASG